MTSSTADTVVSEQADSGAARLAQFMLVPWWVSPEWGWWEEHEQDAVGHALERFLLLPLG